MTGRINIIIMMYSRLSSTGPPYSVLDVSCASGRDVFVLGDRRCDRISVWTYDHGEKSTRNLRVQNHTYAQRRRRYQRLVSYI